MSPPLADDLAAPFSERRRLHILQFLAKRPGYMAETGDIVAHLGAAHFMAVSAGKVMGDLVKLDELGLVIQLGDGLGARLTAAGLEASTGSAHYPGVARPLPE
jgi:hypothetical protein